MDKILRYKTIETNTLQSYSQGKIYFPDQPDLRGAKIRSIEILSASITGSKSPQTFSQVMNDTDIQNCSLTMFQESDRKIDHLPLWALNNMQNNSSAGDANIYTSRRDRDFVNFTPSWDRCYIEISGNTFDSSTGSVFTFGVSYVYDDDKVIF